MTRWMMRPYAERGILSSTLLPVTRPERYPGKYHHARCTILQIDDHEDEALNLFNSR